MSTLIRTLNNEGRAEFRRYLTRLRENPQWAPPHELLSDEQFSSALPDNIELEPQQFATRYEIGVYLVERLQSLDPHAISHDQGLWSWLALYYFDQLCPKNAEGKRKVSQDYNYLLSQDYRHHPRHALRTTWHFVRLYGDQVRFMFSKAPNERGEIIEQLGAQQELAASPGVIAAANVLYDDKESGTFKRGAAGRGAGSIVRFIRVLRQFRLTFDLYEIDGNDLVRMLPREFDRFRPAD